MSNIKKYEFKTVSNALNALKTLNYLDESLVKNIFYTYLYWNHRSAGIAKSVASYFKQQMKYKKLIRKVYENSNYTEDEKNKLRELL